ncbi:MAG TPA: Cro/CI family transcriptional regulator [Methylovorus sp.]|nr:Cro/CI family transcriptional regulator [Methylovorus sp.]
MTQKTDSEIIDAFGGTVEVAKLFNITTGAVSQWRDPENGIPDARLMYLKLLKPEVFEESKAA